MDPRLTTRIQGVPDEADYSQKSWMRVWINRVSEDEASGPAYRPVRLAKKSTQAQDDMTDGNAHDQAGSRSRGGAVVLALFLLQLAGTAHAVQVHMWTEAGHAPPSASIAYDGRVIAVTDGDTLRILYKSGGLKVRLAGIDAPNGARPSGGRRRRRCRPWCLAGQCRWSR
jgi:hypothetical protein